MISVIAAGDTVGRWRSELPAALRRAGEDDAYPSRVAPRAQDRSTADR